MRRVIIDFKTCKHFIIWKKKIRVEITLMKATNKSMLEVDSQTEQVQRDQLIVAHLEWVRLVTVKILLELCPRGDDKKSFPSVQKKK